MCSLHPHRPPDGQERCFPFLLVLFCDSRMREGHQQALSRVVFILALVLSVVPSHWLNVSETEREAAPFYIRAIEQGLSGKDLEGALLGLGSTYRAIGAYQAAEETFRRAMAMFPHHRAFQVFLAMTLYNLHRYQEAVELLLTNLAETTSDETILQYQRTILFYAPQLNQTWDA